MPSYEFAEERARGFLKNVRDYPEGVNARLYHVFVTNSHRVSEGIAGPPHLSLFLDSARADLAHIALIIVNFGMVSPRMAMRIRREEAGA